MGLYTTCMPLSSDTFHDKLFAFDRGDDTAELAPHKTYRLTFTLDLAVESAMASAAASSPRGASQLATDASSTRRKLSCVWCQDWQAEEFCSRCGAGLCEQCAPFFLRYCQVCEEGPFCMWCPCACGPFPPVDLATMRHSLRQVLP